MRTVYYSGTSLKITAREVFDVTLETGEIKTFDSWEELTKFTSDYEWNKHVQYMDYLGIPKTGTVLIKTLDTMCPMAIIMHNRKCVASGYVAADGKVYHLNTTSWKDTHIGGITFSKILDDLSYYQRVWESKFVNYDTAFPERWGNREDGMTAFYYCLGHNRNKESIAIVNIKTLKTNEKGNQTSCR